MSAFHPNFRAAGWTRWRPLLLALPFVFALSLSGCKTPCDKLSDRLCEMVGDDGEACAKWQARAKRVPTETCEASLRELDRDRVR